MVVIDDTASISSCRKSRKKEEKAELHGPVIIKNKTVIIILYHDHFWIIKLLFSSHSISVTPIFYAYRIDGIKRLTAQDIHPDSRFYHFGFICITMVSFIENLASYQFTCFSLSSHNFNRENAG